MVRELENEKHKKFLDEYFLTDPPNAAEAYRRAYKCSGSDPAVAGASASRLLSRLRSTDYYQKKINEVKEIKQELKEATKEGLIKVDVIKFNDITKGILELLEMCTGKRKVKKSTKDGDYETYVFRPEVALNCYNELNKMFGYHAEIKHKLEASLGTTHEIVVRKEEYNNDIKGEIVQGEIIND